MILVLGTAPLQADRRAAVVDAARRMQAVTLTEPGCLLYRFGVALDDPDQLLLHEIWADDDALQTHFDTTHFATFRQLLREALSGPSEFARYDISRPSPLFRSASPPA